MKRFFIVFPIFLLFSALGWTQSSQYFTGNGGRGTSIAILAPQAVGLAANQSYLPALVQGEFVSNFSSFSAISVLDRQQLDVQYKELLSGYYSDNAQASLDLGKLTPTTHIMGGTITKTSTGYALQIQITKSADKTTAASYSGTCTVAELDNLTGIRRASLDLLQKMGVVPTELAKTELSGAAAENQVNSQTALAQGIVAQQKGTIVEALSYFIQSSNYDPSLAEAASRMNILNANITSRNIGADTRNEIAWRRQWVERLQEAETFFANYIKEPQPYFLVYATEIQRGAINWQNETIALSIGMSLIPEASWREPINGVINAVNNGFSSTGKAKDWGIDWPAKSAAGRATPFVNKTANYAVIVEIINEKGTSIGRQTVTVPYGYEMSGGVITMLKGSIITVTFPAVKADENTLTDNLSIRIVSIDGLTAENASRQKKISIMPDASYSNMMKERFAAKIGPVKIGDTGPAGGLVFYDKGNNTGGWRYLEAAPEWADFKNIQWGALGNDVKGTSTAVGTGKRNTELIIAALKQAGETGRAAQLCAGSISGFNDWFLPSKDELDLMYKNLKRRGLGGFSDRWYWSSSQGNSDYARNQYFDGGSQDYHYKIYTYSVRAIRSF
jgi:hypothetical protein